MDRVAPRKAEDKAAPGGVPIPFGNARDSLAFYSALVPRQRTSVAPKALVPLVDTMLLARGKPTRWLCSGEGGESSEKLSTDKDALFRVLKQTGANLMQWAAHPAQPVPCAHGRTAFVCIPLAHTPPHSRTPPLPLFLLLALHTHTPTSPLVPPPSFLPPPHTPRPAECACSPQQRGEHSQASLCGPQGQWGADGAGR